jgi:dipeptidyl aminopeptidase/acylaminoacyl peptidase
VLNRQEDEMRNRIATGLAVATLAVGCLGGYSHASKSIEASGDGEDAAKQVELTLDRIFPKKSFFGPTAGSTSFSHDGRFGAFLYRPYLERRHGSDLYVIETETGQVRRITSVGRMAEFQSDTREVRDDREKRAKKAGISVGQLAAEQASRLGWSVGAVAGAWTGDADRDRGKRVVADGACTLELELAGDFTMSGELSIGLVRFEVSDGRVEDDTLTADVSVEDDEVEGTLELTFDEDEASGTLTLEEPAQTMSIELERSDDDEDGPEHPRGVLGAIGERLTLGDVVLDDDADINDEDEKTGKKPEDPAPRYGGVQGYEWAPKAHELLLLSGGDVYRLSIDPEAWAAPIEPRADEDDPAEDEDEAGDEDDADDEDESADDDDEDGDEDDESADEKPSAKSREPVEPYRGDLTRLTRTREGERSVQYLPDGTGYTYLRDGALLRVSFTDHTITQLDPELEDGERMVGYEISPDQTRLVFLANRGGSMFSSGREVTIVNYRDRTIVNYRDRFAKARQVRRHMPDDPWPESFASVYLYDLAGHENEEGTLERVFTRKRSGPRDIMRVPEWSPDSSRIAFAAYDQASGHVKILEAGFVTEDEDDDEEESETPAEEGEATEDGADEEADDAKATHDGDDEGDDKAEADDDAEEEAPAFEIENAEVVYQFLHYGGPNTPRMVRPQYLPDSRRMIFITEVSGFRQLHLLDPRYEQLSQLTEGPFEIYPVDLSEDHATMFVTATKDDPNQEHVFAVDTETGAMTQLSPGEGDYGTVAVSDDGARVLATHADFGSPRELVAIAIDGDGDDDGEVTTLTDSHPEEAHELTTASPEYFTYQNRHDQTIHGHMFKPADWTPEDKRPLLIYVYGGPLGARKMATRGSFSGPSYFFARYMAEQHGWVTATIDPRGASGYGAAFEKANFEQVGKPQTEDLVDGARWLVEHHGVDEDRLAMHGWSFGGFQTQMVMYTEPDVFAVGIAGAGPTEWHNYNSWYSTGTIGDNEPGKTSLEKYSLLPLAKNLKGKLLLVHGMEDANVLYQDTVRVYRELLKADKEVNVELFLDPTGGHGLGGDVKNIGRYRKYEDFLVRHLGEGEPAAAEEDDDVEEGGEADSADSDE